MATLTIDGLTAYTDSAGEPWSLNQLDANTYQFQIRSGDHFTSPSYTEVGSVERDELSFFDTRYSEGQQINLSETITVEPGPTNTASFLVLTQLHATTNVSPTYCPFSIELDQSDHLLVVLQNPSSGWIPVYRSPDPIVRGQPMDLSSQMVMGPSGGGYVGVWLNGTQIVDYHGAVGATNSDYYLKMGIYRGPAAETTTATISNVQISTGSAPAPTAPTTPTTPTTPITSPVSTTPITVAPMPTAPSTSTPPSVTRPVLAVADPSLWVAGRGGTVPLGINVNTTDPNDRISLNIRGLPKYETITTSDGTRFRGSDITLTAAQVNSGLTLTSTYRGGGHPVATLSLTATATDRTTGDVATTSPQTITVTDPRPARVTTTTSPQTTTTVTDRPLAAATSITATDHPVASSASAGFLAGRGFAQLQQHMESTTNTLATTRPQAIVTDPQLATGTTTAALASQSFALLNQHLAGNTGRVDSGQIVSAVSQAAGWAQEAILTRPH